MKVGIIADNYKVDKFKSELKAIGIEDVTTKPFDMASIIIKTKTNRASEIGDIVRKVDFHFKHAN